MADAAAKQAKLNMAFEDHFEAISRYCHRRLPAADANDATAQVFAVAWRRIDDMPEGGQTLPWLYGVARRQVSSTRRSSRRLANLRAKLSSQAHHHEPGPEAVIIRNDEQANLVEALATLRPQDQEILRLRAYEHLSIAEVAQVLGCSVEAAKKRSARAMKRFQRAAGMPEAHEFGAGSRAVQQGGEG